MNMTYIYKYVYIYICIERERERESLYIGSHIQRGPAPALPSAAVERQDYAALRRSIDGIVQALGDELQCEGRKTVVPLKGPEGPFKGDIDIDMDIGIDIDVDVDVEVEVDIE